MYGIATPRQLSFITVLIPERQVPEDGPYAAQLDELKNGITVDMTKKFASELIGYLMDLPKSDKKRRASVRVGVYQLSDVGLVKVVQARGSKDKYTMQLHPETRTYFDAPALMSALEPHMRMRATDTATWARAEGLCPWCTQVLEPMTNPLQAMGTTCARKLI